MASSLLPQPSVSRNMFPLLKSASDPFTPPSHFVLLLKHPVKFLLRAIYRLLALLRRKPLIHDFPIRVVCISDTHTLTSAGIPPGDLLIHAGDLTNIGSISEIQQHIRWLASLPHQHKVIIAGNHDTYLDPRSRRTLPEGLRSGSLDWMGIKYLQHSSVALHFPSKSGRVLHVYGAPQIPACGGPEFAFQYQRGLDAWTDTVPSRTDILVTHAPPKFHRDLPLHSAQGCEWLLREIWRVRPRMHVFGHVHFGAGKELVLWDDAQLAYERGMERGLKRAGLLGMACEIFDVRLWTAVVWCLVSSLRGILWDHVWGGEAFGTWLVNAGLMKGNSGKIGNRVQVVDI